MTGKLRSKRVAGISGAAVFQRTGIQRSKLIKSVRGPLRIIASQREVRSCRAARTGATSHLVGPGVETC